MDLLIGKALGMTGKTGFDHTLRTAVDASGAEDTFLFLHIIRSDQEFDIETNGTVTRAGQTKPAFVLVRPKNKRRPLEEMTDFSSQNHKRCHPADMVAE